MGQKRCQTRRGTRAARRAFLIGVWVVLGSCVSTSSLSASSGHAGVGRAAPSGPGQVGAWATGRKMGVGTAVAPASKVWFTIAEGILSEVYYPTLDNPDVGSLQYAVTDGHTTWRESADTAHAVRLLRPHALAYRVTNTAHDGSYRITTDYCADPARSVLLLRSRFEALRPSAALDRLYIVFRPNINGTSLTNTATVQRTESGPALVATNASGVYGPAAAALLAQPPLGEASVGFHGTVSDPWAVLRADHRLTSHYRSAARGTVVGAAAVALRPGHQVTLALGFGQASAGAIASARAALRVPFDRQLAAYVAGWQRYADGLTVPAGLAPDLLSQFYTSVLVLKATEDKTYPGAMIASPTIPWGNAQTAGSDRVGGYHLVWARDLYEVASALLAAGDRATAARALAYLFNRQQDAMGAVPQNTWLNGEVRWSGLQMDQVAYPIILAWQLGQADSTTYRRHIQTAAHFLIHFGPITQQERWEEQGGYSPSTIAAEIAALACAADIARRNGDAANATLFGAVADDWARHVAAWTVTRTGHLSHAPYYIRIDDNTDPNDGATVQLANSAGIFDERDVVDAGFLELVRLGIVPAADPTVRHSLAVVDRTIRVTTHGGPAWYRYNHDGYGEAADGSAYTGAGVGRLWPLLTGERGEYALAAGDKAQGMALLSTLRSFAYGAGMLPEQVWDRAAVPATPGVGADDLGADPAAGSIGLRTGAATGSAGPLSWSMAQYVRLAADLGAGRILERPAAVAARYLSHPLPAGPALTVSAPPPNHHHFTSPLLVRGHAQPGARVLIALYTVDSQRLFSVPLSSNGDFARALPLGLSENVIVVLAVDARGNSSVERRTVTRQL